MDKKINFKEAYSFRDSFSAKIYFTLKNDCFPSIFLIADIDYEKLIKKVKKEFSPVDENCFFEYKIGEEKKLDMGMIEIESNLMLIFFDCSDEEFGEAAMLFNHLTNEKKKEKLKKIILSCRNKKKIGGRIYILQHSRHFQLSGFELPYFKTDIESNYNDDLPETDKLIIERLNKNDDKGILFLYGKPGTGKTWYIRSLIKRVKKRMIFIPPDVASLIGKPEFMSFLTDYSNSIIIIEDAENLVMESAERKSVVSNILNLSDGLLSDCFHIQVICTFNTDIQKIDKALLRKGRVIARYEFKSLEKTKAQKLLEKLGSTEKAEQDMTLAEIYNINEKDFEDSGTKKKLGF